MRVFVGLQPDLVIRVSEGDIGRIINAAFYKIYIKRYVEKQVENNLFFYGEISYISIKKIIDVFSINSATIHYTLEVDPSVTEYISNREMFLDTRAKLGIEIKKQDSKLLEKYNSFKSIVDRNLERSLREKQMWDSFFMTTMKKSCNFSVPGSGKTSSVYGMYAFLKDKGIINKIVVICPKNAFAPWIDEFAACFGDKESLRLFNIHDTGANTKLKRKASIKFDTGGSNLILFNYECIKTYLNEIKSLITHDTLLVFDEVHKVKRINGEYAKAAIEISKNAKYIVAMTGTPIPNSYQDIYNLLHILYGEEYNDFFSFQAGALQRPSALVIQNVNKKIQPFFCRTTKQQLGVPMPNSDSIIPVPVNEKEQKIFKLLFTKYKKNKLLLMLRVLQLESQAQQLLSSINLADFQYLLTDDVPINEIDYADYSKELIECINDSVLSSKTEQCINLVKGLILQKKPVIIWCIFVKSIQNLAEILIKEGISVKCIYGEIELSDRQQIISEFKNHHFEVLITNPNTLAESISLHNICHDAIYFEYSFNLVHLLQSKDRIHRLGLSQDQYTQFYFLQSVYPQNNNYYSMGEQIYKRLSSKEQIMLQAIDSDLLEIMPTTQEELEMIFAPLR